eukprot:COSAG01_NODE_2174_length_8226_cov_8.763961_4_plen_81_part_00
MPARRDGQPSRQPPTSNQRNPATFCKRRRRRRGVGALRRERKHELGQSVCAGNIGRPLLLLLLLPHLDRRPATHGRQISA